MKRKAWAILRAFLKSSMVLACSTARSGSKSSAKYSWAARLRSSSVANSVRMVAGAIRAFVETGRFENTVNPVALDEA